MGLSARFALFFVRTTRSLGVGMVKSWYHEVPYILIRLV
jgi:hypothetical protein